MSEIIFPGVPIREDCASCPDTGPRCPLHQNMYLRALKRQSEAGAAKQSQQAQPDDRSGHQVTKQPNMSKKAVKAMNRTKNEESQMINALRRMNFDESTKKARLSRQQLRDQKKDKAAPAPPDPVKVAKRQEKAARRAADPERVARLEAHRQNGAVRKARIKAKHSRNIVQHGNQGKNSSQSAIAEELVAAPQLDDMDDKVISTGPASRTRGQNASREVHKKLEDLAIVHSMTVEAGSDDFLARADSLIDQVLASMQSALSAADRKSLEEALSLVRTTQLLSSKDYRPAPRDNEQDRPDHFVHGHMSEDHTVYKAEDTTENVPMKLQFADANHSLESNRDGVFHGLLRGGARGSSGFLHSSGAERDDMVE
ncbi:hypothetical protein E4T47_02423 [Aureobasidium subglaciale]|nr:hypothetical protein E4T47_02423 [Aureobasidium subglaciale]